MTLGMENKQLSRLIFVETMLIGFISLVVGIGLGVYFLKDYQYLANYLKLI